MMIASLLLHCTNVKCTFIYCYFRMILRLIVLIFLKDMHFYQMFHSKGIYIMKLEKALIELDVLHATELKSFSNTCESFSQLNS